MRAKKIFGQHFLRDEKIVQRLVDNFPIVEGAKILEVGPGMGVLTEKLLPHYGDRLYAVEVDVDMYNHLIKKFPEFKSHLIHKDFLKLKLDEQFPGPLVILGNFPYNISSQIVFTILDYRHQVKSMLGMFQKEVAVRMVSGPGSKDYGILSVLVAAYYDTEYLFDVPPQSFDPPPKVNSGVIRFTRNATDTLPCNETVFKQVVKLAFNQRRKMLRNSIKQIMKPGMEENPLFTKRPEQLSLQDFIYITNNLVQG